MDQILIIFTSICILANGQNFQNPDFGSFGEDSSKDEIDCPPNAAFLPDPSQCDAYYECKGNKGLRVLCPNGLVYNDQLTSVPRYPCSYPAEVSCGSRVKRQEPLPSSTCPNQNGLFRASDSPSDCGNYLNCVQGRPYPQKCPEGLAFNPATVRCDWPDEVVECDGESYLGFTCPRDGGGGQTQGGQQGPGQGGPGSGFGGGNQGQEGPGGPGGIIQGPGNGPGIGNQFGNGPQQQAYGVPDSGNQGFGINNNIQQGFGGAQGPQFNNNGFGQEYGVPDGFNANFGSSNQGLNNNSPDNIGLSVPEFDGGYINNNLGALQGGRPEYGLPGDALGKTRRQLQQQQRVILDVDAKFYNRPRRIRRIRRVRRKIGKRRKRSRDDGGFNNFNSFMNFINFYNGNSKEEEEEFGMRMRPKRRMDAATNFQLDKGFVPNYIGFGGSNSPNFPIYDPSGEFQVPGPSNVNNNVAGKRLEYGAELGLSPGQPIGPDEVNNNGFNPQQQDPFTPQQQNNGFNPQQQQGYNDPFAPPPQQQVNNNGNTDPFNQQNGLNPQQPSQYGLPGEFDNIGGSLPPQQQGVNNEYQDLLNPPPPLQQQNNINFNDPNGIGPPPGSNFDINNNDLGPPPPQNNNFNFQQQNEYGIPGSNGFGSQAGPGGVNNGNGNPNDPFQVNNQGQQQQQQGGDKGTGSVGSHPRYPHQTDCKKFFVCVNGTMPRLHFCETGQVFNPATSTCDDQANVSTCSNYYPSEILDAIKKLKSYDTRLLP